LRRRILHAGSGGTSLPPHFGDCEEVQLDADPATGPDIVASIVDLGDIGPFDIVYCSHTLEHIYPHEVPIALREFRRVLAEEGQLILFVPDLEGLTISEDVLFVSFAGPVSALDLIYGHRREIKESPFMAHHTGFTSESLEAALYEAGFSRVAMKRLPDCYNLMAGAMR
jgi:ubiquinone/menaquinone biosynthesis C-methylase UbiE